MSISGSEDAPDFSDLPSLRATIAAFGLSAKKSLGQHFLLDGNLTEKIARAAGDLSGASVIEIGPGPGGLTRALLKTNARQLFVIERDARFSEALAMLKDKSGSRLTVLQDDALTVASHELGQAPRFIVANLPYNVATPLLVGWITHASAFAGLILMFQKEVVDRIIAQPGNKTYGRLSILTQWRFQATRLFDLPPQAFTPPPKVFSSVIKLVPRPTPLAPAQQKSLETVTAAAFQQRRKMLRQSLRSIFAAPDTILSSLGIVPTERPENLPISAFCSLANVWDASREKG